MSWLWGRRDEDPELVRGKRWLFFAVGLLVSGIFSFNELRYMLFAHSAQATVERVFETGTSERNRLLAVEYTFVHAEGKQHAERDDVSTSFEIPDEGPVEVHYLAGVDDSSRLAGNRSVWAVIVFVVLAGIVAIQIVRLGMEANRPIERSRGPRRR